MAVQSNEQARFFDIPDFEAVTDGLVGPEIRSEVSQRLAVFAHAVDNEAWTLLPEVMDDAIEIEGEFILSGLAAYRQKLALAGGYGHHHVNVVMRRSGEQLIESWSRLIVIDGSGKAATSDVIDRWNMGPSGWRITRRFLHPRHPRSSPHSNLAKRPSWW